MRFIAGDRRCAASCWVRSDSAVTFWRNGRLRQPTACVPAVEPRNGDSVSVALPAVEDAVVQGYPSCYSDAASARSQRQTSPSGSRS